ncbi:MAG TPA: peptidase domain-containing ABC transporter [Chitinophagaceae bacterium]|nr:peptidase domain-containing ABC transporter [Chitinophagaceae bacterium]
MAGFPFFRQPGSMDCGPACLKMIAKYYGKDYSLQSFRDRTQVGKEGVNLFGISEAAESIGFRTQAVRVDYESLVSRAFLPCILHWDQNHFVILFKAKKNRLHIVDPSIGIIKLSPREFINRWITDHKKNNDQGIALLLEPTPAFYTNTDAGNNAVETKKNKGLKFGNVFSYILPYRKLITQLFIGLGIGSVLQLIIPFLSRSVVDIGIKDANLSFIYIVLLAQLALFAGRFFLDFIRSWILLHVSTRINISILNDFLVKLLKLPVAFFDSKNTGDILQRMNDHQRIESFLTSSSINVVFSFINLIIFSVVLAIFDSTIFFVFIILTFLYSCWIAAFLKKRRVLDYKRFDIAAREQNAAIQMIQGMQEIKINGIENSIRSKWVQIQGTLYRLIFDGQKLTQWQNAGAFFINEGKNILITFLSARAVIQGDMTLGSMVAIQFIIGQLNSPVEQMINFVQSLQYARISLQRLNEVHTLDDEEPLEKQFIKELPLSKENAVSAGSAIILTGVSFTYPGAGNEPVLHNINLKIPIGKTTAIVGVSGSGKTTLLKLLLKFYPPGNGDILLDDVSLSAISHKTWRRSCGVVMQDSFIFSDTIAGNIALGEEKIDEERLANAAAQANIKELVESLPMQYQTKIGPEGSGLSMGQKQRILIARAVYRNPEFIFFDEATNSLDSNNESVILHNLQTFFEGKTVVVVAHRLSTVKNASQIVVLKNGMIAETGTHKELIGLKGEYYTLVKNQLELEN